MLAISWYAIMICFLAFVNVMYVTRCNGLKSGIVVRFNEIAFHSEMMAVYILRYDSIYIRVKRQATIWNRHNKIPHPAFKTKREITKYIN